MKRLYLRIYLAVLGSLFLFAMLAALGFKLLGGERSDRDMSKAVAVMAAQLLPADSSGQQLTQTLAQTHQHLKVDLTVFAANGALLASAGAALALPTERVRAQALNGDYWHRGSLVMPLPGERILVATNSSPGHYFGPGKGLAFLLGLLTLAGLAVAIMAWPLARRVTRRLESLQNAVRKFGDGNLASRASVKGKDEVASLAMSFNESADHIEKLVAAQKSLLANASHELRSPLARIRMAVELIRGKDGDQPAQRELQRNIGELDELIDEILLASRLDADSARSQASWAELDLGGLVAEEAARCGLSPHLGSLPIRGDAKLLRRMIRNLLENALRYGAGKSVGDPPDNDPELRRALKNSIQVSLEASKQAVTLAVCDQGPGVPVDERERIFEPFYRARGSSERAGGVGLGLSLVRQIAALHGGAARCAPRDGGGSCFYVELPAQLLISINNR